jgi:hypothetical protein
MFKENSEGPTSVAISKEGETLNSIPNLSKEAQRYLTPTLAPPISTSPLGAPWQTENQLSPKQQTNRRQFLEILQKYASKLTQTQQSAISKLAQPVTPEEIRQILRKQKRNSYNPNEPMALLKELPDEALPIISQYVTNSLLYPTMTNATDLIAHMILLPKKEATNLQHVRPITMCSAMHKLTAQVISTRIAKIIQQDNFLLPTNVGFTPHGETHHLILPLQIMYDLNHIQQKQHIHTLMVDLSQAYDRVPWWALHQTLQHLHFPPEIISFISHRAENTKLHLKFPQGLDPEPVTFEPTRGIKQGCPLSPILFAIFNDTILRWIHQQTPGYQLGNQRITALGFADDMGLISTDSPHQLQAQVEILHQWATITDQHINTDKTKILTTDANSNWQVSNPKDNLPFEKVQSFKYLGVYVHATLNQHTATTTHHQIQSKTTKFITRLNKLKYLPIDKLTKVAAFKSAIQTLIPYGLYAAHPNQIPMNNLQTIVNHTLKGGPRQWHLCNAITQDVKLGPQIPNIEKEYIYQVLTELHRLINQNNVAGKLLKYYLSRISHHHKWPVNPMDPATISIPLEEPWEHTLIHKWRGWMKAASPALHVTWISPLEELNPGGWTHFLTSAKFNHPDTPLNRTTYTLRESTRSKLAEHNIYSLQDLRQLNPTIHTSILTLDELREVDILLIGTPQDTTSTLPNPWEPSIKPAWPTEVTTTADGAQQDNQMSMAWAAATSTEYANQTVTPDQQGSGPVYGYLNSTLAETYGLEAALKANWQQNSATHPVLHEHAQDNQGTVATYQKLIEESDFDPAHFHTKQQARPVWRRLLNHKEELQQMATVTWKRGHADNADINYADSLTKEALAPIPLEQAQQIFPDLNPFIQGMDPVSMLLTFHRRPNLNIAHPLLPVSETLKRTRDSLDPNPQYLITLRHDGTRDQFHKLWTHLHTQTTGQTSPLYKFIQSRTDYKTCNHALTTTQKGYKVLPKARPVGDNGSLSDPLNLGQIQTIHKLRAGLWTVHETLETTNGDQTLKQPAIRICKFCNKIASLHHLLCECTYPPIWHHKNKLNTHLKTQHLIPQRDQTFTKTCTRASQFSPHTPTSMVNTRWDLPGRPVPQLTHSTLEENPKCLHQWLGLSQPNTSPAKRQQFRLALLHTTTAIVSTFMEHKTDLAGAKPISQLVQATKPAFISPPQGPPPPAPQKRIKKLPTPKPSGWTLVKPKCASGRNCQNSAKKGFLHCAKHKPKATPQRDIPTTEYWHKDKYQVTVPVIPCYPSRRTKFFELEEQDLEEQTIDNKLIAFFQPAPIATFTRQSSIVPTPTTSRGAFVISNHPSNPQTENHPF